MPFLRSIIARAYAQLEEDFPMDQTKNLHEAALRAYGALWRDVSTDSISGVARRLLRDVLTKEDRAKGVAWALKEFGPVSDYEAIAFDIRAGVFPEKSTP